MNTGKTVGELMDWLSQLSRTREVATDVVRTRGSGETERETLLVFPDAYGFPKDPTDTLVLWEKVEEL